MLVHSLPSTLGLTTQVRNAYDGLFDNVLKMNIIEFWLTADQSLRPDSYYTLCCPLVYTPLTDLSVVINNAYMIAHNFYPETLMVVV